MKRRKIINSVEFQIKYVLAEEKREQNENKNNLCWTDISIKI